MDTAHVSTGNTESLHRNMNKTKSFEKEKKQALGSFPFLFYVHGSFASCRSLHHTWETETELPWDPGQIELYNETLSKEKLINFYQ